MLYCSGYHPQIYEQTKVTLLEKKKKFLGLSLMFDYTTLYTIEESVCIYLTPIQMSYFTLKDIPTSSICKFICLNYPIFIK